LEREVGPVTFEFDVPDEEALQTLILWKSAQYRRTGRFDRFAKQWIAAVVRNLLKTRSDECTGTLSMLYASGKPIAAHFGPRSQSVLCSWFPAYDISFARYKPGLVLFDRMAEAAAAQGIRSMDLGKGQEDYKKLLRSEDIALAEGWVERPSSATLFRRVQRAPGRHVQNFVLSRPALRRAARRALEGFGRVRSLR
jgi:CelD/BcsL family acetyltransferase involved in cellulose biosynthesis